MSAAPLTGLARLPLLFLRRAPRQGIDPIELARRAGVTERDLQDPDARVPFSRILAFWKSAIALAAHPATGLRLGAALKPREMGLVGYAMCHSRDLGQALDRLARYQRILNEAFECRVLRKRYRAHVITSGAPPLDALRHPVEARLAGILAAAREITGTDLAPVEVRFPYGRPDDVAEHKRYFRCPLLFERPRPELVLPRELLDLPIVLRDETLRGYLDRLADDALRSLEAGDSFVERTRRALWSGLSGGRPGLASTASAMGVSTRTLQRRLREHGTGFGETLEGLRREMALSLLEDSSVAVKEVAFLLGYSDPSTFHRAFRRWTGRSPRDYRRTVA